MDSAARLTGWDLAVLSAGGPPALPGAFRNEFRLWLAGKGFAESTQLTYYKRARGYLRWLAASDAHPDAFTDGPGRDAAVVDYLEQASPPTRKVTLAALRALYDSLDLGPVLVDPVAVGQVVPRTLSTEEQSRVFDAAAARSARDYALITLGLDVGPRPSELRRLNDEDVALSAQAGAVRLVGPDGRSRTAGLAQGTTWVLMGWRRERRALLGPKSRERAFFVTLSSRRRIDEVESLEYIVSMIGIDAGLPWKLTPSALRATVEKRLHDSGLERAAVAARMGQTFVNAPRVRALMFGDIRSSRMDSTHHGSSGR
ncbi:tyrosine-type recombinase/integrase [Nocardia wallacei]|uniref:tyrosine-type recombinase/integrase n=1 Tax=Nocardia wallacei TaxID=480035 RepID=UPI0024564AC6|nr:tyrosine-type recombinase/integrase [Nocardia wallacei]